MTSVRWLVGRAWDGRVWRPEHARLFWFQVAGRNRNRTAGLTDHDHLVAAAHWLGRAQDASPDGGVCGRYLVHRGWTSSYPETTGYIVPTFLGLARELGDRRFEDRAARCVEFLLGLQLPTGAFPAGEVHENTNRPSVFNTAQILGGLVAWHASSRDPRALAAAHRAADWLVSVQDADGAWRHDVYGGVAATYHAHASCWLAEFADSSGEPSHRDAAARHLEWVLRHYDSRTGWFDLAGFTAGEHAARRAVTHAIGYTLWGVLRTSEILGRGDGAAAVERAAVGIARRLQLTGRLPGVLDHRWRGHADYACLTGNAQMALVWLRLYRRRGDAALLNGALKALDLVKRAQPMHVCDGNIRGGIPGSDPIWGEYLYNAFPNWAAKFFVDALLEKERVLEDVLARSRGTWEVPRDVPRSLPPLPPEEPGRPVRVVLYANPVTHKVAQMTTAWASWGFRPTTVVVERGLGTLNAHMGILPHYRGMNVTEWARFNGDPVGCTVHLIDPGIDTGDILCVRAVNVNDGVNIPQLRTLVDRAQIELLGEVVRFIA